MKQLPDRAVSLCQPLWSGILHRVPHAEAKKNKTLTGRRLCLAWYHDTKYQILHFDLKLIHFVCKVCEMNMQYQALGCSYRKKRTALGFLFIAS